MVCTSPPYWSLRDYGVAGQIGLERSVGEYVAAMVAVFREVKRVLRDDGCAWLNLGDSFNSSPSNQNGRGLDGKTRGGNAEMGRASRDVPGLAPKNLLLIPERVALALQADGWVVRAKPCWYKMNCMPESCTDRPTMAHESIFLLSKGPTYFYDAEATRRPHAREWDAATNGGSMATTRHHDSKIGGSNRHDRPYPEPNPAGRNRRTSDWFNESLDEAIEYHEARADHLRRVRDKGGLLEGEGGEPLALRVASQPTPLAHFATFPERLIRPMILASTSEAGCCPECGRGWEREVEREPMVIARSGRREQMGRFGRTQASGTMVSPARSTTLGFRPACACPPAPPVPCTVFDPFIGAGTTIVVANELGRHGVGCDLNPDYLRMADRRITRPHSPMTRPARAAAADRRPLFDGPEGD